MFSRRTATFDPNGVSSVLGIFGVGGLLPHFPHTLFADATSSDRAMARLGLPRVLFDCLSPIITSDKISQSRGTF